MGRGEPIFSKTPALRRVLANRSRAIAGIVAALTCHWGMAASPALADERGVSLWLPGQFGSLAALPSQPGWQGAMVFYHTAPAAGAGQTFPRGARVDAGLDSKAGLIFGNVNYVFATPVLGAQAAIGVIGAAGRVTASIDATLTGPLGNTISGSRTDTVTGFADLYPLATLKWNQGVNNFMTYLFGDIPVGAYSPNRLANIGIGHGGIDGGVGYTYFNPQTGYEFSVVTGLTYNFKNTDTDYQNGINWHADWGASRFLSKQLHIGLVGYFYQQLTDDSGSGAIAGGFRSRVIGIGPQIGYIFSAGEGIQGYANLKGYKEFAAQNRPEGYNVWVTLAFSPAAPETGATPTMRRVIK